MAALVTGAIIGWLNGFIIVKFGIPSLVVTIGTQFFWRGAVLVLTQGANFSLEYIKPTFFYPLFVGKIGRYFPMQMFWLIVITILGWVLLNRHRFGAHVYLIGDNINSAELMGVNTGRTRIQAFMLVGLVSAFAGILASFYVAYFWPSLGDGYLLRPWHPSSWAARPSSAASARSWERSWELLSLVPSKLRRWPLA